MAMMIYRIEADSNRYVGLHDMREDVFRDDYKRMCVGMSLASKWNPKAVQIEITEGLAADLVHGPVFFADISVSETAVETVRSLTKDACELLPYSYQQLKYWALYIPWPTDCLDADASEYWTEVRDVDGLQRAVFIENELPKKQSLFRLPNGWNYYCTQEFKDAIESAELTGLVFHFVWSSDGTIPKEPKRKPIAKKNLSRILKEPSRRTKRDLLLARLWEAIDSFGSEKCLNSTLSVKAADLKGAQDVIAADTEVLKAAVKHGIAKKDLQRLCRSIAYKSVFETLVAIEEECLDRSSALKGLHEDLLMADPKR